MKPKRQSITGHNPQDPPYLTPLFLKNLYLPATVLLKRITMEPPPPLYFLPELVQVLEDNGIEGHDQSGYTFMLALKHQENEDLDDVDMEVFTFFCDMGLGALEDDESRKHHIVGLCFRDLSPSGLGPPNPRRKVTMASLPLLLRHCQIYAERST